MIQYGVLSYTDTCNNVMTPTVFTNLAFHREWIDEQIGNSGDPKITTPKILPGSDSTTPGITTGSDPTTKEITTGNPDGSTTPSGDTSTPKGDSTTPIGSSQKPRSGDLESCVKGCLKWDEKCSEPEGDLAFLRSLKLEGL